MQKHIRMFLGLVWAEWSSRVTGSFSALLVLLGLGLSIAGAFGATVLGESIIQVATWTLAAICVGQAAFSVWARERKTVDELKEKIRPKLKCSFGMNDPFCVRPKTQFSPKPNTGGSLFAYDSSSRTISGYAPENPGTLLPTMGVMHSFGGPQVTYYRRKVECDGIDSVSNCRGRLETITKNGVAVDWEPSLLPFVSAQSADSLVKKIHEKSPELLDFMFISDSNKAQLTPPNFQGSSSVDWQNLLSNPAIYTMRINILSDTPTVACDVVFNWTGDRTTSEITCHPVS
jgi:hypothetical protein